MNCKIKEPNAVTEEPPTCYAVHFEKVPNNFTVFII